MALPTLAQMQKAVNFLSAYTAGQNPATPTDIDVVATVLSALGYYNGSVAAGQSRAVGSPLSAAWVSFNNDMNGAGDDPSATPFSYVGGPPAIYPTLNAVIQQALANISSGHVPSHVSGSVAGGSAAGGGIAGFLATTQGKVAVGAGLLAAAVLVAKAQKK